MEWKGPSGGMWAWSQRGIGLVVFTATLSAVTSLAVSLTTLAWSRHLDAKRSAREDVLLELQAESIAAQLTREWAVGKAELDSVRQKERAAARADANPSQRAYWAEEERWRVERLDGIDLALAVRQGRRPRTVGLVDSFPPARITDLRVSRDPHSEALYFIMLARVLLAVQGIHVQSVSVKAIPDSSVISPRRP
jgi:hypothetical protein